MATFSSAASASFVGVTTPFDAGLTGQVVLAVIPVTNAVFSACTNAGVRAFVAKSAPKRLSIAAATASELELAPGPIKSITADRSSPPAVAEAAATSTVSPTRSARSATRSPSGFSSICVSEIPRFLNMVTILASSCRLLTSLQISRPTLSAASP